MSLVELMLAMTVVLVGVVSYLGAVVGVDGLRAASHQTGLAIEAARGVVTDLQSEPFDELVRLFDADPDNDPGGPGTAPGSTFDIEGLDRRDAAVTAAGEVVLPLDGVGALREDLVLPELGMPRDLNGDGVIDGADHSADYQLLPVLVRVRWDGKSECTVELRTLLCDRD